MKRLLCLILVLALSVTVMAACGSNADEPATAQTENNAENSPSTSNEEVATENTDVNSESDTPEKDTPETSSKAPANTPKKEESNSSNNQTITDFSNAPDVYLISSGGNDADSISYHLKGCSALSGSEYQKITWEMVQTLGFRQCTKCNPPKYEGYID